MLIHSQFSLHHSSPLSVNIISLPVPSLTYTFSTASCTRLSAASFSPPLNALTPVILYTSSELTGLFIRPFANLSSEHKNLVLYILSSWSVNKPIRSILYLTYLYAICKVIITNSHRYEIQILSSFVIFFGGVGLFVKGVYLRSTVQLKTSWPI